MARVDVPVRLEYDHEKLARLVRDASRRIVARLTRRTELTRLNRTALKAWVRARHRVLASGWEGEHFVVHWVGRCC